MLQILTVCTGNICRSPLAELLLSARLADLGVGVSSAGTFAPEAAPMTPEAQHLAVALGADLAAIDAHRSRRLVEQHLATPDLILPMTRDHRRAVAELAPSRLRSTFTLREFARIADAVPEHEVVAAVEQAGPDASARVRAMSGVVHSYRGLAAPAADPADDDVIDPFRRSWDVYQLSASQLAPAVDSVVRIVRLAVA